MDSASISGHIEELVAEEHRLLERGEQKTLSTEDHARLAEVNVQLDRYYDLLRQRRASEEFGQDTASAQLRSGETVEKYLQ